MNEYKILGEGWYGIVIQPPIKCDKMEMDINDVGKISNKKVLEPEFEFIMHLLRSSVNTTIKKYLNNTNVHFCKLIESSELPKEVSKFFDDDKDLYQLSMPYLGKTFYDYLEEYKNICENRQESKKIMKIKTYKKYIHALVTLYSEIKEFNKNKIYHNDIKPNNIIYNESDNEFILIDYNLSLNHKIINQYVLNIKPFQDVKDIKDFVENVLYYFLKISFNNKEIFNKMKDIYYEMYKISFETHNDMRNETIIFKKTSSIC